MTVKQTQGIALATLSVFLFFAGTGLCLLNHYDKNEGFLSVPNLLAVMMAAFLTVGEFSFLWADYRLMMAKKVIKKVGCAAVLVSLIATMSWVIGTEWESAEAKVRSKMGLSAVATINKDALSAAKSKGERTAATGSAMATAKEITRGLAESSTRAYQVNFFFALFGFVVCHFCIEKAKARTKGRGDVLATNKSLQDAVRAKGLSPDEAKAYQLQDGTGYAVHHRGQYHSFIPAHMVQSPEDDGKSDSTKKRIGFA